MSAKKKQQKNKKTRVSFIFVIYFAPTVLNHTESGHVSGSER